LKYNGNNTEPFLVTYLWQMAFSMAVYPAVLLTYAGQTSYLIVHREEHLEGFFKMMPRLVFWPMFSIATAAKDSQA
jgi:KUP system potassium uptake protein